MLHGGTLWNVSYGFPRGVKLLCLGFVLFFTSFILFSLFYSLNVNITVWGHWIVRVFFNFYFPVILPFCAYAYSILWTLTFLGSSDLFFHLICRLDWHKLDQPIYLITTQDPTW